MTIRTFKLCIKTDDEEIIQWYKKRIEEHNQKFHENKCMDSGFDLCIPEDHVFCTYECNDGSSQFLDMKVSGSMESEEGASEGYYMYARSSISKTPLQLANSVGIIDSGYRGTFRGGFRNLSKKEYTVGKFTRLLQICSGDLRPFKVVLCDSLDNTERGEGGFGSTGV